MRNKYGRPKISPTTTVSNDLDADEDDLHPEKSPEGSTNRAIEEIELGLETIGITRRPFSLQA